MPRQEKRWDSLRSAHPTVYEISRLYLCALRSASELERPLYRRSAAATFSLRDLGNMLKVHLPDGKVLEYSRPIRPIDIAAEIGPRLAKATIAAEVDGQIVGATAFLPSEGEVRLRLITSRDPEAINVM